MKRMNPTQQRQYDIACLYDNYCMLRSNDEAQKEQAINNIVILGNITGIKSLDALIEYFKTSNFNCKEMIIKKLKDILNDNLI